MTPSEHGPPCTCGSRAVIDAQRHALDCHRRQWIEVVDDARRVIAAYLGGG
jgi:hypothetical protein